MINIEVTNISVHPISVTSLGWTVGVFRKQHFDQVPDWTDPLTFRLPTRLEYGQSAHYNLPREEFFRNAGQRLQAHLDRDALVERAFHFSSGLDLRLSQQFPVSRRGVAWSSLSESSQRTESIGDHVPAVDTASWYASFYSASRDSTRAIAPCELNAPCLLQT